MVGAELELILELKMAFVQLVKKPDTLSFGCFFIGFGFVFQAGEVQIKIRGDVCFHPV